MISQKLYECVWCKHLYQEPPSSCDCMGNEENLYEAWTAHKDEHCLFKEIKEGFVALEEDSDGSTHKMD